MPRRSAWTLLSLRLLARPTVAYIDPGSGSYFIQLLIGTVVGVGAVLLFPFRKVLARLFRRRSTERPGPPPQEG
jgi:hypothetical protein